MSEQPSATSGNALNQLNIDQAAMGYAVLREAPLLDSLLAVRAGHAALGEADQQWLASPAASNMLQLQQLHQMRHLNMQMAQQGAHAQFNTYLQMAPIFRVEASPYLPALSLGSPHTHSRDTQQVSPR